MAVRKIVKINEEKCNGCGLCVTPCAEGAIEIVDGKAKVVREELCDGAGFCLAVCPTGALSIEEREAPEFSEEAARERAAERAEERAAATGQPKAQITQRCFLCGAGEGAEVLMPCRFKGDSLWVCVRCLPRLIHG
ncbi:MAG: 4Fe-4S binding protein [Firmicutes bacterium]|jgi:MinD superfamily P-loop ATPase|nr:4Fe-4S binding protein [Bacillota bacterium]MDH7496367.1 4Fe-4S binding protein [Bacillota bacterium]